MDYNDFLQQKQIVNIPTGYDPGPLNAYLKDFQRDITRWAVRRGRACVWAGTGLGKTIMQLSWADEICKHTGGNALLVAPLSVSKQTHREGHKFGIESTICRKQEDVKPGINIANYEMLDHFDCSSYVAVIIDESGILKHFSSKTRNQIIDSFRDTKYKLACSATPAPNDFMEIGNHAEFVGAMTRTEMLSMFFVHDSGDTAKWRLKKHATSEFWKWVCTWAVMLRMPSDLHYDDNGFILPPLNMHQHVAKSPSFSNGELFPGNKLTLNDRRAARRDSIDDRAEIVKQLVDENPDEQWLIWCNLNTEADKLEKLLPDAIGVRGADSDKHKEQTAIDFADGNVNCLISKASIYGHGMNWQSCHKMILFGLSDSFEEIYQAIRRCWRYGQKHPVDVHVIISDQEGAVLDNIKRKETDFEEMQKEMVANMADINSVEIKGIVKSESDYKLNKASGEGWEIWNGDSCELMKQIPDNSLHFSLFSPPFYSLFTYSASLRDLGNSKTDNEFEHHFRFIIKELFRTIMPGRIVAIHCMNIPAMKERDGYIGIKNFRNKIEEMFEAEGFIFHSEIVIWKDPLIEATRTKALGLMHKQLCKDSSRCRQGLPDYMVVMRKPGDNPEPVTHDGGLKVFYGEDEPEGGVYSHNVWRRYASPVWMDIRQGNTLNVLAARHDDDERHIAPLQLDVINRCLELWSNPGDTVFSPFTGIGSEGYGALQLGRRFLGIELKPSYFEQAVKNMPRAISRSTQKQMSII